jgi:hypothetical protein
MIIFLIDGAEHFLATAKPIIHFSNDRVEHYEQGNFVIEREKMTNIFNAYIRYNASFDCRTYINIEKPDKCFEEYELHYLEKKLAEQ